MSWHVTIPRGMESGNEARISADNSPAASSCRPTAASPRHSACAAAQTHHAASVLLVLALIPCLSPEGFQLEHTYSIIPDMYVFSCKLPGTIAPPTDSVPKWAWLQVAVMSCDVVSTF